MFKQAIIHYPTDKNAMAQIGKDLAAFRCDAAIRYIEALKLDDRQIEALFDSLEEEIAAMRKKRLTE